jgi:hypothetical protein
MFGAPTMQHRGEVVDPVGPGQLADPTGPLEGTGNGISFD